MKLSKETLNLLKFFASINPGIIVDPGKRVFSQAINKTCRTTALIEEEFTEPFAIFNLAQFLNTISFIDDPDIKFTSEKAIIQSSDESQKVVYYFSSPDLVKQENRELKTVLSEDVKFSITSDELSRLNKACSIMGLNDICVFNRGNHIFISCLNKAVKACSAFELKVGECPEDTPEYKVYFKKANLKLTEHDFDVSISSRGLSTWKATNSPYDELIVYIAVETDSEFNKAE